MTQAPWLSPDLLPEHKDIGHWAMIDNGQPVRTTLEEIVARIKKGPGRPPFSGEPVNTVPAWVAAPDSARFVPALDRPELRDVWLENVVDGGLESQIDLFGAVLFTVVWVFMGVASEKWFGMYAIMAIGCWAAVAQRVHGVFASRRNPERFALQLREELFFDCWNARVSWGHRSRSTWMAAAMVLVFIAQVAATLIDREDAGSLGIMRAALDKSLWTSEPWRLVTAVFMHGGFIHLCLNLGGMLSLIGSLDATRARWWGPAIWLAGALGGSLTSAQFESMPSVGASGGIIALMVFVMTAASRDRNILPKSFLRQLWISAMLVGLIGVVGIGYIDNAAHFGGGVVGLLGGLIFRMSGTGLWSGYPTREAPIWAWFVDLLLASIVVLTLVLLLTPSSGNL